MWEGLDEAGQTALSSSYEAYKYEGCNIPHDDCSSHLWTMCRKVVKIVSPRNSHRKENLSLSPSSLHLYFFSFYMKRWLLAEPVKVII